MKNHFKKFLIIIPLLLVAGGTFAAYTFVGPTAAPTSNNTDGPLDISATDQIKNGGLSVNTFQSRTGSDFLQQTTFTGLVNGGTVAAGTSSIPFGTSANKASIKETGNATIAGNYQSDSLKTGGGVKPLCANATGTFYICGTTTVPTNINPIYLYSNWLLTGSQGNVAVGATLSEATNSNVTVTLSAISGTGGGSAALQYIKNMYTADAFYQGVCRYTTTPTVMGTVTIFAGSTSSWDTLLLSPGCDQTNTSVFISSYSPHTTMGGRSIIAQ